MAPLPSPLALSTPPTAASQLPHMCLQFVLPGNGPFNDGEGDISTGRPEDSNLGWGMAETALLAVGETVILLHPPLPLVGVSIGMERGCQQNDSPADG